MLNDAATKDHSHQFNKATEGNIMFTNAIVSGKDSKGALSYDNGKLGGHHCLSYGSNSPRQRSQTLAEIKFLSKARTNQPVQNRRNTDQTGLNSFNWLFCCPYSFQGTLW